MDPESINLLEEAADCKGGQTSSGVRWWSIKLLHYLSRPAVLVTFCVQYKQYSTVLIGPNGLTLASH